MVIADENKRSAAALRYWFRILDLHNTGRIGEEEIKSFYDSQVGNKRRLEWSGLMNSYNDWRKMAFNALTIHYTSPPCKEW